MVRVREGLVREYQCMIEMRDNEITAQRQIFEAEMQAKDRERHSLKSKLEHA